MSDFERQKNIRAGTYTGIVLGMLLFLLFIISWTIPQPAPVPQEEGIEVNLGNSETGEGDIQPMIPGPPAMAEQEVNNPPRTQLTEQEETREVETNDNDREAPEVRVPKPLVPKKESTVLPKKENTTPVRNSKPGPQTVDNSKPAAPKPKYVMKSGETAGKGGNNADSWNSNRNQGIAGGTGDQGKPGGNPESDSYTGNGGSGKSGVSISRGLTGRRITRLPSFEDDFNENAKIAVDIRVDRNGSVLSAGYQPRGSTTSNSTLRDIALRKARQLKFSPDTSGPEEQLGTIIFNFRLKN
jgi:hypothetical protein